MTLSTLITLFSRDSLNGVDTTTPSSDTGTIVSFVASCECIWFIFRINNNPKIELQVLNFHH